MSFLLNFFRRRTLVNTTSNKQFDEIRKEMLNELDELQTIVRYGGSDKSQRVFDVTRKGHINRFTNSIFTGSFKFNNLAAKALSVVDDDVKKMAEAAQSPEAIEKMKNALEYVQSKAAENSDDPDKTNVSFDKFGLPNVPENVSKSTSSLPSSISKREYHTSSRDMEDINPQASQSDYTLNSWASCDMCPTYVPRHRFDADNDSPKSKRSFSIFPKIDAAPREFDDYNDFTGYLSRCNPETGATIANISDEERKFLKNAAKDSAVIISNYEKDIEKIIKDKKTPRFYLCHTEDYWKHKSFGSKERKVVRDGNEFHINNYAIDSALDFNCARVAAAFNTTVAGMGKGGACLDSYGAAFLDGPSLISVIREVNGPNWREYYIPNIHYVPKSVPWYLRLFVSAE